MDRVGLGLCDLIWLGLAEVKMDSLRRGFETIFMVQNTKIGFCFLLFVFSRQGFVQPILALSSFGTKAVLEGLPLP